MLKQNGGWMLIEMHLLMVWYITVVVSVIKKFIRKGSCKPDI